MSATHSPVSKVIVTGATGFIGRNVAEGLVGDGLDVVATGRNERVGRELCAQGTSFRAADLEIAAEVEEAFSPADCVIHCAAKSGDWGRLRDFHRANVVGTRNVIAACRRHGIARIVFVSTPSVYVDGRDRFGIRESEDLPRRQLTPYSATKLAAERELLGLAPEGFEVIIFRPRAVYGLHDQNFVPRLRRMANDGRFPLIGGGRALVDVTYVENFVDLVRAALRAPPDAWNRVYNASNGDPVPIAEWFEMMLEVQGVPFRPKPVPELAAWFLAAVMETATHLPFGPKKPLMTRFAVRYIARSMTLSIEEAVARLGYAPRFSTKESFIDYATRI